MTDSNMHSQAPELRSSRFAGRRLFLSKRLAFPSGKESLLFLFLMTVTAIFMIPVYYLLVTTFKSGAEAATAPMALPRVWHIEAYVKAFGKMHYPRALWNTFYIAALTVILNLSLSSAASYVLARRPSRFHRFVYLLFVCGMMIPFQMGLAALIQLMSALRLVNTPYSVIMINASSGLISSIFLMKAFVNSSVPREMEEAGRIDGCNVFGLFFRLVFPLMKPILATMSIIILLGSWNDFLNPLLFLQSSSRAVLLQELSTNIGPFSVDWASMFPMLVLAVLPLTLLYLVLQRFIIDGVAAGAVKG